MERFIDKILQKIALWCLEKSKGVKAIKFDLDIWEARSDSKVLIVYRKGMKHDKYETARMYFGDDKVIYVKRAED